MQPEQEIPKHIVYKDDFGISNRLVKKMKECPFMTVGVLGGLSLLGYMLYHFPKRDKTTRTSMYIMQSRIAIQGTVVACVTAGLMYQMYSTYMKKDSKSIL